MVIIKNLLLNRRLTDAVLFSEVYIKSEESRRITVVSNMNVYNYENTLTLSL